MKNKSFSSSCSILLGLLLFCGAAALPVNAQMIPFAFWKARNLFTWMGGSKVQNISGFYGTQGTAGANNNPGQRTGSSSWVDGSGNLWVFGGFGYDVGGSGACVLSDLWEYVPGSGTWTWMGGPAAGCQTGEYGTLGVAASSNNPGARAFAASWVDGSGNFWLFGGNGDDGYGVWDDLSDLWKYNPSTHLWTWVSGPDHGAQPGIYGTKNVANAGNIPGGRSGANGVMDGAGNFWIFGGIGYDNTGGHGSLNDLWKYAPGTGLWTWVSGATAGNTLPQYGPKGSASTSYFPGSKAYAASWFDASGNFWLFGGNAYDGSGTSMVNDLWQFTPGNGKWVWVSGANSFNGSATYGTKGIGSTGNTPSARYAQSGFKDTSGFFWIFGGYGYDTNTDSELLNELWSFDPTNKKWTWVSGVNVINQSALYGTQGVGSTGNAPGSRYEMAAGVDASNNFWIFGGNGYDGLGQSTSLNDVWKYTPSNGNWAWMAGPVTDMQMARWGTLGVGNTGNSPAARYGSLSWVDASGNFWLMGGSGADNGGNLSLLSDVWKYVPGTRTWTWVTGSKNSSQPGVTGTQGIGSTGNIPGSRSGGVTWADASGNLWLLGGNGFDINGASGDLNDFWKFNPGTGQWTWMSGASSNTVDGTAHYGTKTTASTANIPGARDAAVSWTDGSGNLWLLGGYARDKNNSYGLLNDLWKYIPGSGTWTWMSGVNTKNPSGNYGSKGTGSASTVPGGRSGAVSWTDSSGTMWLFGGAGYDGAGTTGALNDLWKYTPGGNWTWVAGANTVNQNGIYGTQGVAGATNTPGGRSSAAAWVDGGGNLWLWGGNGYDGGGTLDLLNDLWKYSPSTNQWTWMAGSNLVGGTGNYGTLAVPGRPNIPGARSLPTVWTDSKGTAWLFGGYGLDSNGAYGDQNDLWKFSP
jgi:N-acetylneuraminic acid mutarotase